MPGLEQLTALNVARDSQNAALQGRIDALNAGLKGNICLIDPKLYETPDIDQHAPVVPADLPQPADHPPFNGDLAALLDQATVLIIAPSAHRRDEAEEGSGFFISPSLIVTNDHVIADANPTEILVFIDKLKLPVIANVVASTHNVTPGGPDFAVLQVNAQPAIQPLALTSTVAQLEPVTAAGFPADEELEDQKFEALVQGDLSSGAPSVDLTSGEISAIQTSDQGEKILPHTAFISQGNSGGPLVDQCGRVVGIDTFNFVDRAEDVHLNFAIAAGELEDFLNAQNIPSTNLTGACSTQSAAITPP